MKDQDYIKIMDRISKNKIEEAFTWDASAQQNRRSIRRLSLGIGTIAMKAVMRSAISSADTERSKALSAQTAIRSSWTIITIISRLGILPMDRKVLLRRTRWII